jgi:hypothetical protein
MRTNDADDLVLFPDVRVVRSTAPALLCRIGDRSVWLPRLHISGKLWCTGDRGKLFIRRWVARDRRLIGPDGEATMPCMVRGIGPTNLPAELRLVSKLRAPRARPS